MGEREPFAATQLDKASESTGVVQAPHTEVDNNLNRFLFTELPSTTEPTKKFIVAISQEYIPE